MTLPLLTQVFFAVLDSDEPEKWTPWGIAPITKLREGLNTIDLNSLDPYCQTFQPDLIPKPFPDLLNLENWSGIVGAVVDATALPRLDIRRAHKQLCQRIAKSSDALCQKTGYHLIFCVNRGSNNGAHLEFMNDLRRDADVTLKLKGQRKTSMVRVISDDHFKPTVENLLIQIGIVNEEAD